MSPPSSEPISTPAAVAIALVVAILTATAGCAALFGGPEATWRALDFNAAPLEDFLGPYWRTAQNLAAGRAEPAPGYLYPSTLSWLIAPVIACGFDGPFAASTMASGMILGSLALFLWAAFTLARPERAIHAALAGAALGLAHATVHGAYWAQASLPAIALTAAAFALQERRRPGLAGAALGLAATLKLYPAVAILAWIVPAWRPRALAAFALVFTGLGVALPAALMGASGFLDFHAVVWERLGEMSRWVFTADAGSGSQDLPSVLHRFQGFGSMVWPMRALGAAAAVGLAAAGIAALRRQVPLAAFVFFAAIPWAAISPTWPHGLLWIPAGWWLAARTPSRLAWAFTFASVAAGSLMALRLTGSPENFVGSDLPAWSAFYCLSAVAISMMTEHEAHPCLA